MIHWLHFLLIAYQADHLVAVDDSFYLDMRMLVEFLLMQRWWRGHTKEQYLVKRIVLFEFFFSSPEVAWKGEKCLKLSLRLRLILLPNFLSEATTKETNIWCVVCTCYLWLIPWGSYSVASRWIELYFTLFLVVGADDEFEASARV